MDLNVNVYDTLKQFTQTVFLDVNNTRGMVLSRKDLEKVIENKGSLIGATLAPGVQVQGLNFDFVKVDQSMLKVLIAKGADVTRVDLSYQNLMYMNINEEDLSRKNCSGTIFTYALVEGTSFSHATFTEETNFDCVTFNRTNFTGCDLNKPSLNGATVVSVIVGDNDCRPYIDSYTNRLTLLLGSLHILDEYSEQTNDPFNKLPKNVKEDFCKHILFDLSNHSLESGKTSLDHGPQDIVVGADLDDRIVKKCMHDIKLTPQEIENHKKIAIGKLLGDDFTQFQKILFHHARSAVDGLLKLNGLMLEHGLLTSIEFQKNRLLAQIYIEGGEGEPRVGPELMGSCFELALLHLLKNHPNDISLQQIEEVRELFLSPSYCWP
jgi:hypothetical protein